MLALLLAPPAPAPEYRAIRVGGILAVARAPELTLAIALAEQARQAENWYGLGLRTPGPLTLIVVRGTGGAERVLHAPVPAWGAGFAVPGARTVVVRADAGDPVGILRHELAHLALHDAVRVRVPLWFDEGYAAVAAGEWDRLEALRLNLTVARGTVPGFFELDRALRASASDAEAAYALAASAVVMLARRNPERSLAPLLAKLESGEGFDAAVLATTGSPLGRFELEWQKDVRRRYGLLVWVMAGGLWTLVAMAVLAAVWLRRRRDRPRRAALDQGWVVEVEEDGPPPLDQEGPTP
jgi:peptidase MA superfamily protein